MEQKLISVIVPVYNVEQYLDRCVRSILNQTYRNLEIILVDDGATDSSGRMCDGYATQDARIKVVHKQNGGLSDARNAGLAVASGEYIGYVDSDDWIAPDMYEKMYEACTLHDAQVAICRYASEFKDRTVAEGTNEVTAFPREELLKAYIRDDDRYIIYNSVWSKLFRRDLVDGVLFPVGRNSEDIMYTTRAFCNAKAGVYIDSPFYHYVQDREDSIMNVRQADRMFNDEIPFWQEHVAYISKHVSSQMGDYAEFFYYRRLLSYFVTLYSEKSTRDLAIRICHILYEDKARVREIYQQKNIPHGDKLRMKLFLHNSKLYAFINKWYEKIIIPLRQ